MSLFAEASTTVSTLASYMATLPEQFELLIFGALLATVAFLLRTAPVKNDKEAEEKA